MAKKTDLSFPEKDGLRAVLFLRAYKIDVLATGFYSFRRRNMISCVYTERKERWSFLLGTRIADLRNKMGWTQAELARRLNISPSAVGMYEQGRREPSVDTLLAISRVFCVSTEFLLTGQGLSRREILHTSGRPLSMLTREELLVLLTASLLGEQACQG